MAERIGSERWLIVGSRNGRFLFISRGHFASTLVGFTVAARDRACFPDVSHVDSSTDVSEVVFHECARVSVCAQFGKTALDYAKQRGHHDVAQLIEVRFRQTMRRLSLHSYCSLANAIVRALCVFAVR